MSDSFRSRHYRDSRVLQVGEGTDEAQLGIIAKHLGFPGALAG